ncbi:MAG: tryptophan--tRNA ligase [bacterium]|nr:tryptophan--tRNA ligase [bacterium]
MQQKILFSGIQPSGILHIGNYLGAIKQWVELQNQYRSFFCVVDEHAITVPQEPKELLENTLKTAAIYLAAGIDPKKSTIFVQSHVPAHAELGWILNTLTPMGELERMTQYKDKALRPAIRSLSGKIISGVPPHNITNVLKHVEQIITDEAKKNIYAGLFIYPTLMAADILLYKTDVVPVGEDQLQHIELARSLAERFNNRFGETFVVPKAIINKSSARIMGLDDPSGKMSKSAQSANNYISLLDTPDEIRKKIKIAVTDSGSEVIYDEKEKPAISNLIAIYSLFSDNSRENLQKEFAGKGYGEFKKDLAEAIIEGLAPLQRNYQEISNNKNELLKILRAGTETAREIAEKTLKEAKEKMGFLPA